MTEKQKAKQLVDSFEHLVAWDYQYDEAPIFENQKACAKLLADEVIKALNSIPKYATCEKFEAKKEYWNNVKTEIQKL